MNIFFSCIFFRNGAFPKKYLYKINIFDPIASGVFLKE